MLLKFAWKLRPISTFTLLSETRQCRVSSNDEVGCCLVSFFVQLRTTFWFASRSNARLMNFCTHDSIMIQWKISKENRALTFFILHALVSLSALTYWPKVTSLASVAVRFTLHLLFLNENFESRNQCWRFYFGGISGLRSQCTDWWVPT